MFQALRDLIGLGVIPSGARSAKSRNLHLTQFELEFGSQPLRTGEELLARLQALGLKRPMQLTLTRNRNVMVSFKGDQLRIHEGFLSATESVHRAIVTFVQGRTKAERRAAQKVIVTHPIAVAPRAPRRERSHPDDAAVSTKLMDWHTRYNEQHFGGELKPIKVRVSRRMKSRLGHYSVATPDGEAAEIAISRRHLRRHGWQQALDTLLHEMVHQWQDETSRPIDHGRAFRAMARQVGIAPYARRALTAALRSPSVSGDGHTNPDIAAAGQRDNSAL